MHVVVVADCLVARQAGRNAFVATIHRHEVDVHVDEQVALDGTGGDDDLFAMVGLSEMRQCVWVLGIEVVELTTRCKRVVHPVADGVAELGLAHPAVQGERCDEMHVVDTRCRSEVEHLFDDAPTNVRRFHLGQWKRHIVEGNGELHALEQQGRQRLLVAERVQ